MLADDIAWALPQLRAEAEARMLSRANIWRTTGRMVQDEVTGEERIEWEIVHADLPFRLKVPNPASGTRTITIGGVEFQQATAEGHMPADITGLLDGDHIELTAGEWVGTTWRIVEAVKGDQRTARRVPIIEVDRPEEW